MQEKYKVVVTDDYRISRTYFEIISSLSEQATMLSIVIDGNTLRITADGAPDAELPRSVCATESDGLYFFVFTSGKGGLS